MGLGDTIHKATAHVCAEIVIEKTDLRLKGSIETTTYNEWIKSVQTKRNNKLKFIVCFEIAPDTTNPPDFPLNILFHDKAEGSSQSLIIYLQKCADCCKYYCKGEIICTLYGWYSGITITEDVYKKCGSVYT